MTTVSTGNDIFEEYLGAISETDQHTGDIYPFGVRVGVIKMAAPRHERFEFIREMGLGDIDRVFNKRSFNKDVLTFVFPERHMSVHEQQAFMARLEEHPDANKIKRVDILTSSPLLISSFHAEMLRIVTHPDDEIHDGSFNS
jgi:predicted ATPase